MADFGGRLILQNEPIRACTYTVPRERLEAVIKDEILIGITRYVVEDKRCYAVFHPNDPGYPNQWGLCCLDAEEAWDVEQGKGAVLVAILDTGVDLDHPDLRENVNVTMDYDFVNRDMVAQDDHGHGTHVAGIVGAEMNNGVGVAGIAQATILPIKVLNNQGWGYWSWVAQGITYAADCGARVLNMSLGGPSRDPGVEDACNYAYRNRECLVVAAAGNDGSSAPFYPAAFTSVVGVANLESCTSRNISSNYGPANIELSAPGTFVYSTYWDNIYGYLSGTSMASPHVAGTAALVLSRNESLGAAELRNILVLTADDLGFVGYDEYYGFGGVNARKALDVSGPAVPTRYLLARGGSRCDSLLWGIEEQGWGRFCIWRCDCPEGPFALIDSVEESGYDYVWVDVTPRYSMPYYYALSVPGDPELTSAVSAAPRDLPAPSPPPVPGNLRAADHPGDQGGAIDLRWDAPEGMPDPEIRFHVYRADECGEGMVYRLLGDTGGNVFTDRTAIPAVTYCYTVRTFDGELHSPPSNDASAASHGDGRLQWQGSSSPL
jgi:hypothetical protein